MSKENTKKTCFIVMPIADMDGYDKGHFSRVYKHLISPACLAAGYQPVRADDVDTSHYIVVDIMRKIVESDMVLCDLSGRNPNVMFELGFRQAFNLPTVLIKDEKTPNVFDIQGIRHTSYDHNLRIDNVQEKIEKIANALKTTSDNNTQDITSLVQLLALQPAKVPSGVELSQDSSVLLKAINDISSRLTKYESKSQIGLKSASKRSGAIETTIGNERVSVGETLYNIKNTPATELGALVDFDDAYIYILNENGERIAYSKGYAASCFSTIPF